MTAPILHIVVKQIEYEWWLYDFSYSNLRDFTRSFAYNKSEDSCMDLFLARTKTIE